MLSLLLFHWAWLISRVLLHLDGVREMPGQRSSAYHLGPYAIQRVHLICKLGGDDISRHPPDHRGRLILDDHLSSFFPYHRRPPSAVGSHAGEENRQCRRPVTSRDRAEQNVRRRTAGIFLRVLIEAQDKFHPLAAHRHVMVARRDPYLTRP